MSTDPTGMIESGTNSDTGGKAQPIDPPGTTGNANSVRGISGGTDVWQNKMAQTSGIIASGFSLSGLNGQAFAAPGGVFVMGADLASSTFVSANNNGRVDLNSLASVSGANFEVKDGAANTFMATQSAAYLFNASAAYGKAF